MRPSTSILAVALAVGALLPTPVAAQDPTTPPSSTTTSTAPATTTTSAPTATRSTTTPPVSAAVPTTAVPPPAAPAEGTPAAPKVRGVGDSVFYSAQSKVVASLEPDYRPRFRAVLGALIGEMTPTAREMVASADPAAMVIGLGNPDIAEMDGWYRPYTAAARLLRKTTSVPCVVWVNVKQQGVNGFYNVNWQRDATAFNGWLRDARVDGPAGDDPYFANLHVLDWDAATVGHPGWFKADGLHLNATGQTAYANKIARFVGRVCPP